MALMTISYNVSNLVLTALVILSSTQSFQCVDHCSGASIECRLCGSNPFDCKEGPQAFALSLEGFYSPVVWLIFAAFHLGKAVEITGLGKRLSLWMVRIFGKHILGLVYSIVISEILLASFVPSNTARGDGVVLVPILWPLSPLSSKRDNL